MAPLGIQPLIRIQVAMMMDKEIWIMIMIMIMPLLLLLFGWDTSVMSISRQYVLALALTGNNNPNHNDPSQVFFVATSSWQRHPTRSGREIVRKPTPRIPGNWTGWSDRAYLVSSDNDFNNQYNINNNNGDSHVSLGNNMVMAPTLLFATDLLATNRRTIQCMERHFFSIPHQLTQSLACLE